MKTWKSNLNQLRERCLAFTLIELLVTIAVIAILASMILAAIPKAKSAALRIKCANHMRQLAMAAHMYADDNDQNFPARRRRTNTWSYVLKPYYTATNLLVCPKDSVTNSRSYILNGFNDWFQAHLTPEDWDKYKLWQYPKGMRVVDIPKVSDTILFGEKITTNLNYHMDFYQGRGNDIQVVDNARHGNGPKGSGGSNFAFCDTSVRFLKNGLAVYPVNFWAIEESYRNPPSRPPP